MFHSLIALTFTALSLTIALPSTSTEDTLEASSAVDTLVDANTRFAVDLYHKLGDGSGNLFFSPYSISAALGMTAAGARGQTEQEMAGVLHLGGGFNHNDAFSVLDAMVLESAAAGKQELGIANGLCLTGGEVSKDYLSLLRDSYRAEVFNGGLQQINDWASKNTGGRIPKILDRLPSNSVCVLLNAIAFKGQWQSRFRSAQTREAKFYVDGRSSVTHPLMYQRGRFRLLEQPALQVISLPYQGERFSMVVLLPRVVTGLPTIEQSLSADVLTDWLQRLDALSPTAVDVHFPKYRMETDYDLVPACRGLGMADAFEPDAADFRGMGWSVGGLWIDQVKHKAFVMVDEEGTEAAAVTAVGMQMKSSIQRYPSFRADHPFLFLIRENSTGSILFMGRVAQPAA